MHCAIQTVVFSFEVANGAVHGCMRGQGEKGEVSNVGAAKSGRVSGFETQMGE